MERAAHEPTLADLHAALDGESFAAAWTKGTSFSLEEAIAEALTEDAESADPVPVQANGHSSRHRRH